MLGSNWVGGQSTITPVLSDTLSPEGVANCYRITRSGAANQLGSIIPVVNGLTYTTSIYIRKVSGSDTAEFKDINNNIVSIDVTTEWKRYHITSTATSTNGRLYISPENDGDVLEVYGAQFEEASYPTSYIPTYGTIATRTSESCSRTGISSLIGQAEGTIYFEGSQILPQTCVPFQLSDTTNANRVQIEIGSSTAPLCVITSGGTTQAVIVGSTYPLGQNRKIAVTYKANEFKIYQNGVLIGTDTSGSVPISLTALYVGSESGTPYVGFDVKQILHFKTALSSTDAITLTTL
jgi:hypothetical protein